MKSKTIYKTIQYIFIFIFFSIQGRVFCWFKRTEKRKENLLFVCVRRYCISSRDEERKKVERQKSLTVFTHPATHIIIKQVHFFFSCPPVHRPPHFSLFLRVEGWNVPKIIKKIQGIKYKDAQRHSTGRVYTHTHVHIFIKNKVCI